MQRKYSILALIITFLVGIVLSVFALSVFFVSKIGGFELVPEVLKYAAVRTLIENKFVGEIDADTLDAHVFDTVIASLEDEWSYYMTADEYDYYKEYTKNQYVGIGIYIARDSETGAIRIVSVTDDSPADNAGISDGQYLTAIDGQSLADMEISEVKQLIQSKETKILF